MKKYVLICFLTMIGWTGFSQNSCATAMQITEGTYTVNQIDGTGAPAELNCVGSYENGSNAEWYKYETTQEYFVTVSTDLTINTGGDTRVNIYKGSCGNLMCVNGDDDAGNGYLSIVTFHAEPGETYYIVFDNHWESDGFDFKLTESEYVEPLLDFTMSAINFTGGYDPAVADMNGDYLDDIVDVHGEEIHILYQDIDGGFSEATIPTGGSEYLPDWSMAIGDYDANGYNDLVYGAYGGASFIKASEDGTSYSETSTTADGFIFCQRTNFIDINNDGNLDVFICHDVEPNVYYLNDGSGNLVDYHQGGLGDSSNGGNYGSIWVDYDNDGDMDMFIAKCRGGNNDIKINQLHRNNGDGTFTEVAQQAGLADPVQTWSSAWGDFDNDGDFDIFVGASSFTDGHHKLMRNNGDGTFTDVTTGSGFDNLNSTGRENVAYDFNNDGYIDVYGAGGVIMLNNGDMTFTDSGIQILNEPVGDLNNDGFVDIAGPGTIHLNSGNDNNWLKVGLKGIESNINGIGARIEVYSSLGKQIREVRSGTGFAFMNSLNCYFGIGQDTEIEKVIIRWPSGIIDKVYNPSLNTTLVVEEGETTECNMPTAISVSDITSSSASISWTEDGQANQWLIKYGTPGFNPETQGSIVEDTDGTLGETIENLTENTSYEIYVMAKCNEEVFSEWAGPKIFTTEALSLANVNLNEIAFYPNPVKNTIHIQTQFDTSASHYAIYGLSGKLIKEGSLENEHAVDVQNLSEGLYFFTLTTEGKTIQSKFIKS